MIDSILMTKEELISLTEFLEEAIVSPDLERSLDTDALRTAEKVYEKLQDVLLSVELYNVDTTNLEIWADE